MDNTKFIKAICSFCCGILLSGTTMGQMNSGNIAISAFSGANSVHLGDFTGKKVIIAVLPDTSAAAGNPFLLLLDSLAISHPSTLQVIAVPSIEDGSPATADAGFILRYRQLLDTSILIEWPLFTRKDAAQQDDLFSWLTHAARNGHFDYDVSGAGQVFLLNENGELISVLMPAALNNPRIIKKLVE